MIYQQLATFETAGEKAFKLVFICGLHVALLVIAATITLRPQLAEVLSRLDVRLVEEAPPAPLQPKKAPPPPKPQVIPQPQEIPQLPKPEVIATAAETAPAISIDAKPVEPQSTPPRFDADYLHNPSPEYPALSRRLGEQGRLMLRVLVGIDGNAREVDVERSSGYPRLDAAAVAAVRHWRFVSARSGFQTIEDWVLVPITFKLT